MYSTNTGQVLPIALMSWCILCVASVWIVAYNFVPGGTLTRERTDVLITVVIFLITIASRDYDSGEVSSVGEKGVRGRVSDDGREGEKEGEVKRVGSERMGLRRRRVNKLPPISEEDEETDEEGEEDGEEEIDFEVDSTGSSVHEERALELLAIEEKECVQLRRRTNKCNTHTPSLTHTLTD